MSLGIAAVFLVSACSDRKVRKMQDFYVVQYVATKENDAIQVVFWNGLP